MRDTNDAYNDFFNAQLTEKDQITDFKKYLKTFLKEIDTECVETNKLSGSLEDFNITSFVKWVIAGPRENITSE